MHLGGLLAVLWILVPGSVPLSSFARTCVVAGGIALCARFIPFGDVGLVAACALLSVLTLGLLLVTREVTINELRRLMDGMWTE
jgi:hypothetical protein